MDSSPVGIILAAGKGTRMKSDLPKGLHQVCGLPMVELIGRAMKDAGVRRPIVVIGHGGELIQEALGGEYEFVWQREQLGTGHAVLMAAPFLKGHSGPVLIAPGDTPLLTGEALEQLVDSLCRTEAKCSLATFRMNAPTGYGRIVRTSEGEISAIVEHKDATPEQRELTEVNPAVYCFDSKTLFDLLPKLSNANAQGEYYLPDAIQKVRESGGRVVGELFEDSDLFLGVNDRWQLAQVERILRLRILKKHALNGVTLTDPDTTFIGLDVTIGPDTVIEPSTYLRGKTSVGSRCRIGPCSRVNDSTIADDCNLLFSTLNEAVMEAGSKCGPYANLRPGTRLGPKVRIGNFVEVKNSTLGESTAVNHLSYIGDSTVGTNTNVGAGTITCNYDGFGKHSTTIGSDVFVGSNSTLVAPVTIADRAMIAAGSVVTRDVPEDALGIGRSRTEVKEGWVPQWRQRRTTGNQ